MKKYIKMVVNIVLLFIAIVVFVQKPSFCEQSLDKLYEEAIKDNDLFALTADEWKNRLDGIINMQDTEHSYSEVAKIKKDLFDEAYKEFKDGYNGTKGDPDYDYIDLLFSTYKEKIDNSMQSAEQLEQQSTGNVVEDSKKQIDSLYDKWLEINKNKPNTANQEELQKYLTEIGTIKVDMEKAWQTLIKNTTDDVSNYEEYTKKYQEVQQDVDSMVDTLIKVLESQAQGKIIYNNPTQTDQTDMSVSSIDDTITDAETFLDKGGKSPIKDGSLSDFSQTISGIFATIAIAIAVIMGGILGVKFMTGGIDEKVEVKQLIIPYIVGCIIVFGAFAIWKIAVDLLGTAI